MSTRAGMGIGMYTPNPDGQGTLDPYSIGGRRYRPKAPEEVLFPIAPMLDMAFQLLAFFILTFKVPSSHTYVDLDLPATPVFSGRSLPAGARPTAVRQIDVDVQNDLVICARADNQGHLKLLRLGAAHVSSVDALADRLRRYARMLEGEPFRVHLVADDHLRYEPAAQIIAACSSVGVSRIRLTWPGLDSF